MSARQPGARSASSLTARLLGSVLLPISLMAFIVGASGSWAISELVESINDRLLGAAVSAITEGVILRDSHIAIEISPSVFGMLANGEHGDVFYSIRQGGRLLAGDATVPNMGKATVVKGLVAYGKGTIGGNPVRIAERTRAFPGISTPVVITVAETLDANDLIINRMYLVLALIEIALIMVVVSMLPFAVRWALRPMDVVCNEMDIRAASDLAPLDNHMVPRELRKLVDAFNGMLTRLEAATQGMRRFTADASHQMRTPLAILRTHVSVLRKAAPGSPDARSAIDDIDEASRRLGHLLVQLLALARADAAGARAQQTLFDVNQIAAAVSADLAPIALGCGVDFQFERAPGHANARGQADVLRELLSNLIDNAIRYCGKGGEVVIKVESSAQGVVIHVDDDGPGIPPADRARVFDRFTRLAPTQAAAGSGLGLSIAQSLASAMGATIELATPPGGRGLRASVFFAPA